MITVEHLGPETLRLGVIRAYGLDLHIRPRKLDDRLDQLLLERGQGLTQVEDEWRQSVRDILRNGRYKPTGRGKPASEYLLRAAADNSFPRINGAVDICNFISLYSLLPVSIWDIDKAGVEHYVVRLGDEDESYVFNSVGQTIDLTDLVVCAAQTEKQPGGIPIVNPVKDSMTTKTADGTHQVAALVYARIDDGPTGSLESICELFRDLLAACGQDVEAVAAVVSLGNSVRI